MINKKRLFDRLLELGEIGKEETGIYCLALSKEENEAHALVRTYMEDAGLDVRVDLAGNLVGRLEGTNPSAPVVMTGSHIDTVYGGGMFDGRLGVIAGVEVLQTMKENGVKPTHPIEVYAYRDEEATRFIGSYSGAGKLTGVNNKTIMEHVDKDGIGIRQALADCGINPDTVYDAQLPAGYAKAHVELHIEQGVVLESKDLSVGVVTGICCQIRGEYIIKGVASHAGSTPMNLRKDALAASAEIMLMIEEVAATYPQAVATVGKIEAFPGGVNVIPGEVHFSIDMRNQTAALRDGMFDEIKEKAEAICEKRGLSMIVNVLMKDAEGKPCAKEIQDIIVEGCKASELEVFKMPSGAGHDSSAFADFCPMGMIFVRSKDGISHNLVEFSSEDDCGDGANVLYYTLLELAK